MRAVLDTSVVIAASAGEMPDEAAISAATLAELHFGVHLARTDDARQARLYRLAEIESRFDPLPVDAMVARSYGLLAAAVAQSGRQPRARAMDLLIAATAHAHRTPLMTRNAEDLCYLEGHVDIRPA
jgi:predicted nucleic acid-binding protein